MQAEFTQIPLNKIRARDNYRKTFKDKSLKELSQSIKENGIIQPLVVQPHELGFVIIAGERRYRAAILAGLVTAPCVIRDVEGFEALKMQIVENVQREAVPFMEEADAILRLRVEGSMDNDEIAKTIGKSSAYVYMMLKLTTLPPEARAIAEKGWISKSVAWELTKIDSPQAIVSAAQDLARPSSSKLISVSGAKHYVRDNFKDSGGRMRKVRISEYGQSDYAANWKYHLVRFTGPQFKRFQEIVRGRTETTVLAESVDLVMRQMNDTELAKAMEA